MTGLRQVLRNRLTTDHPGRIQYAIAPLIAAALWGGMYAVSKWGFRSIPPLTLAFLRVVLGASILLILVRVVKPDRSFGSREWLQFGFLAIWVAITMAMQFVGTAMTNASQGALLTVLTPVFTVLLALVVLDESLSRQKVVGISGAALGTIIVLGGRYDLSALTAEWIFGVIFLFVASFGWAAYTVWGKSLVRRYSALETATYSTLLSIPILGIFVPVELSSLGFLFTQLTTPGVLGAVLYLGVFSTAAAWYLWYKGLEYVDAGTVSVFFFAQPVIGTGLGIVFLGEAIGLQFVIGGVVMTVGIYIVTVAGS